MSNKQKVSGRQIRKAHGNMLALTTALLLCILLTLGIFCFKFSRVVAIGHEERTAIEAAALAAASALSHIVIDDPECGFVSLSDYAPNRKVTIAEDNFYLPVRGLNSLLATVRLDMIIADQLNDKVLKECALRDYDLVIAAKDRLVKVLNESVEPGASATDVDGNSVSPWDDAEKAFQRNALRNDWKLVPGSLELSIGMQEGLVTNMPLPSPNKYSFVDESQQESGFYCAYKNIAYQGKDFVFAACSETAALTDPKKFVTVLPGLPYSIPSVVLCKARYNTSGNAGNNTLVSVACAQPAAVVDRSPAPGGLVVSFPQEQPAKMNSLYALLTNTSVVQSPTDLTRTPLSGDSPNAPLTNIVLPVLKNQNPPFGQTLRVALYDWIRRAGPLLDVDSLLDAMKQDFADSGGPHAVSIQIAKSGTVSLETIAITPDSSLPVSHRQWSAVTGLAIAADSEKNYDVIVKDFVYQRGKQKGGKHAGEPLAISSAKDGSGNVGNIGIEDNTLSVSEFPQGPASGAERPTYSTKNVAIEIRIRRR